jgi:RHS repeat-associated protein
MTGFLCLFTRENPPLAGGRVRVIEENLRGRWLISTYEYDVKGNLIAHIDAAGNRVQMSYDLLGRRLRVDRPEQFNISVLDPAGNAVEARGSDGSRVLREFDFCNRLAAVRYGTPNAAQVVRFTYHDAGQSAPPDAGEHTNGGRCVRIDDEGGTTTFDYDERAHVALKRYRPHGSTKTYDLNLAYRADGQLASVTYPEGGDGRMVLQYEYNQRGGVARVPSVADVIEYDLAGRRTRVRFTNGLDQTYAYDEATRRLRAMQLSGVGGLLRAVQCTHDRVGNLLRMDSADPKLAMTCSYDDLYRLIEAQSDAGEQWTYRYDDVGNLTYKSDVGDYRYGEGGAPATCLTTAGNQIFTYTPLGEMQTTPWGLQTFDPQGRLTRIVAPDGQAQMDLTYNYAGIRVAERSSGISPAVERLTPDALFSIEAGVVVVNLFDGQGVAARQIAGGSTVFLHPDHLGGLAIVTDASGQVIQTLRYDPYGKLLERTGTGPNVPVGFSGGVLDAWSGLLYLSTRYYQPGLGRFVSPDTFVQQIYDATTWWSYAYCRNNPVSYADPSGHSSEGIFFNFFGLIMLAALAISTFGIGTPALAVGAGVLAGGVVGGVTAAKHGGDPSEVLAGVLVGAAVGGLGALLGYHAAMELSVVGGETTFLGTVTGGAVSGAVNGAAIGLATGVAGGKGSLDETWSNVWQGALVGAVAGAITGLASYSFKEGLLGPGKLNVDVSPRKLLGTAALFGAGAGTRFALAGFRGEKVDWKTITGAVLSGLIVAGFKSIANVDKNVPDAADPQNPYPGSKGSIEVLGFLDPKYLGTTSSIFASVSSASFVLHSPVNPASISQFVLSTGGF